MPSGVTRTRTDVDNREHRHMSAKTKEKAIEDLTVSHVRQIDLFEIVETPGSDRSLSNTIELYDALPKYNWAQKREHTSMDEAEFTRVCTVRKVEYRIVVKPAILNKRGKNVLVYPGNREEVVEDALRKFAVAGQGQMLNNDAGVTFSLSQLKAELQSMGHTYDLNEIKEAIMVCRGATLEVYGDSGQTLISSAFFPVVGLTNRRGYLENSDARCYVAFNPLVTKSILSLTFRQFDYRLAMTINSPLARYMYKRMSHYWIQASAANPYTPSLVSFLTQSPRGLSEDMYTNTRAMTNALKALIKAKVISEYTEQIVKDGRKIVDVRYHILPHEEFIKMVKAANYRAKEIQQQAEVATITSTLKRPRALTSS